jgi:SAM-dependent methyltransferase
MAKNKKWQDRWVNKNNWPASQFAKRVFVFLKNKPRGTLLDLGCGGGRDSLYFARRGFKVTALDVLEGGQQQAKLKKAGAEFVKSDIRGMKIKSDSFDFIYAHLSLHYFSDAEISGILDDLYAALRPGGYLFIKCKSINDPLFKRGKKLEKNFYEYRAMTRHFFSKEYMAEKLKEFRIVKIQKTNTFLHPCKASFIEATVKKDNGKICSKIKS